MSSTTFFKNDHDHDDDDGDSQMKEKKTRNFFFLEKKLNSIWLFVWLHIVCVYVFVCFLYLNKKIYKIETKTKKSTISLHDDDDDFYVTTKKNMMK